MVAWYSYSILSPSAGIGYFIVFLKVQPFAYSRFVVKLREFFRLPVNRTISTQSDLYRLSNSASTRCSDLGYSGSGNGTGRGSEVGGAGTGTGAGVTGSTGADLSTHSSRVRGLGSISGLIAGFGGLGGLNRNEELLRANTTHSATTHSTTSFSETMNCETMDDDMLITRIDEMHKAFQAQEVVVTGNPILPKENNQL